MTTTTTPVSNSALRGTCASDLRIVDRCPRCGRASEGDEQHGIARTAEESGDGLVHDGGCDHCCACVAERRRARG